MKPASLTQIVLDEASQQHTTVTPMQIMIEDIVTGGRGYNDLGGMQFSPKMWAADCYHQHEWYHELCMDANPAALVQVTLAYMEYRDTAVYVPLGWMHERSTGERTNVNGYDPRINQEYREFKAAQDTYNMLPETKKGLYRAFKLHQQYGEYPANDAVKKKQ